MRYFGGKSRIAGKIATYLESVREPDQPYVEPFMGSANVLCLMTGNRSGSDKHPDMVMLLQEVATETFNYPESVSEQEYKDLRNSPPSARRAFVGFGCSYAGKWFGGYARDGSRDFAKNASASLRKKSKQLSGVNITHSDYRDINPTGCLVYCDPPYIDTTPIHNAKFDTPEFWDRIREWSKTNTVVVSEYVAPADFSCVLEIPTRTDILGKNGQYSRVEKLFSVNARLHGRKDE